MSDDPTKLLPREKGATTQPMLDTILSELREFRAEANARFAALEERAARAGIRSDRIESVVLETRADVRELQLAMREREKEPV